MAEIWHSAPEYVKFLHPEVANSVRAGLMYHFRKCNPGVMKLGESGRRGGYHFPDSKILLVTKFACDPANMVIARKIASKIGSLQKPVKDTSIALNIAGYEFPITTRTISDVQDTVNQICRVASDSMDHQDRIIILAKRMKNILIREKKAWQLIEIYRRRFHDEDNLKLTIASLIKQMNDAGIKPKIRVTAPPKNFQNVQFTSVRSANSAKQIV